MRAENQEKAINSFKRALQGNIRQDYPKDWATIQNELGAMYIERILGDRAKNLEIAINCCEEALKEYTYSNSSKEKETKAAIQNNLGVAYKSRILKDKAENLEKAIDYFNQALQVYTYEDFPEDWAMVQKNLGVAYKNHLFQDKADRFERAIDCYQNALKVYTRNTHPNKWSETKNNLGNAYLDRILGKQEQNLEKAICCYKQALNIRTREVFPQGYAETKFNLGLAYQKSNQWQLAHDTFANAIDTIESLRGEIVSGSEANEAKQKLAEQWHEIYRRMVEVSLKLNNSIEAIEYAERSKTRNLVELILSRDINTIFPPEITSQLEQLRDKIAKDQDKLQNGTVDDPTALAQHLHNLRQQRNNLQDQYLRVGSSFNFAQFQATLDNQTAIVEFYIISNKLLVFIFTHQSQEPTVWQSEPKYLDKLANWTKGYFRAYYNKESHWQHRLSTRLHLLAKILHIDEIIQQIPPECDRLILIPHRFLHLLPLHALPVWNSRFKNLPIKFWLFLIKLDCLAGLLFLRQLFLDVFPGGVRYAPSCQILELAQTRNRPDLISLFAVQNPTENLIYSDLEVETIRSFLSSSEVLARQAATEKAVKNYQNFPSVHCGHFSCHGEFNPISPLESALILADNKHWTLGEIFELSLSQCRLITLSACETGLIDRNNLSDEYIGLPNGFLFAGSPSIISSLWTVSDLSTAFLMVKFYENLPQSPQAGEVAISLKQAQKWLRNLTIEELDRFLAQYKPQVEKTLAQLRPGQRLRFEESLKQIRQRQPHPFAHPYYWAAFTAIGI